MDVDIHLRRDDARHIHQDSNPVNALQTDGGVEEQLLVHVPLGIQDTIAEAGLQFVGYRTGTLVNLYLVLVVDIAQNVVTRYRVATMLELILTDVLFTDVDRLFAVELLGYDEQLLLFAGSSLFLASSQEWHQLAPAYLAVAVFAVQFVQVFLA